MNRIGFAASLFVAVAGLVSIQLIYLLEKTLPVLGRMASQFSIDNRYGELMYAPDYGIPKAIAIGMVILGVGISVAFYSREKRST